MKIDENKKENGKEDIEYLMQKSKILNCADRMKSLCHVGCYLGRMDWRRDELEGEGG